LGAQIPLQVFDSIAGAASPIVRSIERGIPGTEEHHQQLVRQTQGQLGQDVANEEKQAQTAGLNAEVPLREAEAQKAQIEAAGYPGEQAEKQKLEDAQIQNLLHPQAKTAFEAWRAQNPDAPVEDFLKAQQAVKPTKVETPQSQTFDELVKRGIPMEKALEMTKERPTVINQNSETAALDRESTRFAKAHEKNVDAASAQLEKIADAKAMINGNAESQALGLPKVLTALVSGQGSGVRITQAELNMIGKARGIQGDLEGWLNKVSGKGQLTAEQKNQLSQILSDVQARITQKQAISNDALDKINGAGSREDIIKADKEARQKLTDLEKSSSGGGVDVKAPNGKTYHFNDQAGATKFKQEAGIP
jgi:hypothetical protein